MHYRVYNPRDCLSPVSFFFFLSSPLLEERHVLKHVFIYSTLCTVKWKKNLRWLWWYFVQPLRLKNILKDFYCELAVYVGGYRCLWRTCKSTSSGLQALSYLVRILGKNIVLFKSNVPVTIETFLQHPKI